MRVLIIGSGGREDAIAQKLHRDGVEILAVPGNPGIARTARCVPCGITNNAALISCARHFQPDLTVVGPEIPLSLGIVDDFQKEGLPIFGPTREAAKLEWSKEFAKTLVHNVPTASFVVERNATRAKIRYQQFDHCVCVLKADKLAAGKGVFISEGEKNREKGEKFIDWIFEKGLGPVIIEDLLEGQEVSYMVFTDGKTFIPMPAARDHKRLYEPDGPMTGGMAAYSPVPDFTPELEKKVEQRILIPLLNAMRQQGTPYKGVLYLGLMIVQEEPFLLEVNTRFGDPEAQVILPLMESPLLPVLFAVKEGNLAKIAANVRWSEQSAVCLVAAAKGYPGPPDPEKGQKIKGIEAALAMPDSHIFFAGIAKERGHWVTNGGRIFGVTGLGRTLEDARDCAYSVFKNIDFPGMRYRKDILDPGCP